MAHPNLRVYFGPEDDGNQSALSQKSSEQTISVPLGEILPALTDAVNTRRAWLQDFANNQVAISTDLYEVLLAYEELRPTG